VPDCQILTTSSPRHHRHLVQGLGADRAFDRSVASASSPDLLVDEIKAATPGSRGVDAIIDAVGAGASERYIFDVLDPGGPRRYAQVWTGYEEVVVPVGVDSKLFRSRDVSSIEGGSNVMRGLQNLLAEGKYKLPLPLRRVGAGLESLEEAVQISLKGVSGEKLVVSV
jgi:NADPH:quinone reductase-like Zn-dependent oxidoreductase